MSQNTFDDKSTLIPVIDSWRQKANTWANVDPTICRQMMSVGHNE